MELQIVTKKQSKILLALLGGAGTGKTYSALQLAYGITGNWGKVAVIDTENSSASYYSHLGPFNTLQISQHYTTINYIEAIQLCHEAAIEVIIIDSISPEWNGQYGFIDNYCSIKGDSYKRWDEVMHMHREFMNTLIYSPVHIISTVKSVNKVPQAEAGFEHYFDTVLELKRDHEALVIKDRSSVCKKNGSFLITPSLGAELFEWSSTGEVMVPEDLQARIDKCRTINQLYNILLKQDIPMEFMKAFTQKANELEGLPSLQKYSKAS
jgi:KaiC/GvpD/RAD55 family RecA-like ATPase